mmetsp:Transcript_13589/g.17092  ORF Transcript_13589/g.17092 Transcript_13589/m.17092 type:complete len:723 (+) Transcript_13589:57-2225(+)|eukprot:CAMPEP_0172495820 /NCGR_PEP_ID=MMETSP1066-20121228/78179_1 /TAXON_ID=671091 /ORGANISM="Coscinodiscus wailesii, Strain CCMP2513" /LENGTH=722 /DNA_ID=CAMNT_0013267771 /DNA_START=57 /DNA_END=2225 /DNA_ORIENTATION=+
MSMSNSSIMAGNIAFDIPLPKRQHQNATLKSPIQTKLESHSPREAPTLASITEKLKSASQRRNNLLQSPISGKSIISPRKPYPCSNNDGREKENCENWHNNGSEERVAKAIKQKNELICQKSVKLAMRSDNIREKVETVTKQREEEARLLENEIDERVQSARERRTKMLEETQKSLEEKSCDKMRRGADALKTFEKESQRLGMAVRSKIRSVITRKEKMTEELVQEKSNKIAKKMLKGEVAKKQWEEKMKMLSTETDSKLRLAAKRKESLLKSNTTNIEKTINAKLEQGKQALKLQQDKSAELQTNIEEKLTKATSRRKEQLTSHTKRLNEKHNIQAQKATEVMQNDQSERLQLAHKIDDKLTKAQTQREITQAQKVATQNDKFKQIWDNQTQMKLLEEDNAAKRDSEWRAKLLDANERKLQQTLEKRNALAQYHHETNEKINALKWNDALEQSKHQQKIDDKLFKAAVNKAVLKEEELQKRLSPRPLTSPRTANNNSNNNSGSSLTKIEHRLSAAERRRENHLGAAAARRASTHREEKLQAWKEQMDVTKREREISLDNRLRSAEKRLQQRLMERQMSGINKVMLSSGAGSSLSAVVSPRRLLDDDCVRQQREEELGRKMAEASRRREQVLQSRVEKAGYHSSSKKKKCADDNDGATGDCDNVRFLKGEETRTPSRRLVFEETGILGEQNRGDDNISKGEEDNSVEATASDSASEGTCVIL